MPKEICPTNGLKLPQEETFKKGNAQLINWWATTVADRSEAQQRNKNSMPKKIFSSHGGELLVDDDRLQLSEVSTLLEYSLSGEFHSERNFSYFQSLNTTTVYQLLKSNKICFFWEADLYCQRRFALFKPNFLPGWSSANCQNLMKRTQLNGLRT